MLRAAGMRTFSKGALANMSGLRCLSSEPGILSSIKNTITGGSNTPSTSTSSRDQKYAEQIEKMAHSESWTLNSFTDQIREATGGWRSMIPGMGSLDAMKQMKETQKLLEAAVDVLGGQTSAAELKKLGKKEKLQISLKSGAAMQDINALVQQFESMDIMHRVLRYRVANNLPLPDNEADAKAIMQTDIKDALSERERRDMQRQRQKLLRKLRR